MDINWVIYIIEIIVMTIVFKSPDEKVRAFAERLFELNVQKIYTGHCTGTRAFEILKDVLGDRAEQMYTGMQIEV